MNLSELSQDRFPMIYEHGRPVAVLVDLATFQRMLEAVAQLKDLVEDQNEVKWIIDLVRTTQAYRESHPNEVETYDSPEAILAALDAPDA